MCHVPAARRARPLRRFSRGRLSFVLRREAAGEPSGEDWNAEPARAAVVVTAQHRTGRVQVGIGDAPLAIQRTQLLVGRHPAAELLRGAQALEGLPPCAPPGAPPPPPKPP